MLGAMRVFLIGVLVLAACGEIRQVHRWPDHRREKDEQISTLEQKANVLGTKNDELEARVRKLEEELAKLRQAAPAQAAPAALPSPGS